MAQQGTGNVVIDFNTPAANPNTNNNVNGGANGNKENKKTPDSLFGPNIGVVSTGPAWTSANEKKVLADVLTPDVVKGWVEKSKEANQPTTTLQALVNLKRPTLRLSPLSASVPDNADEEDIAHPHHHAHGLEFEYDCDAPKCGIYVSVLLPSTHPDAPPASSLSTNLAKLLVFETVVEGGFGRTLKLAEGATLELGRFESHAGNAKGSSNASDNADSSPSGGPSGDSGTPSGIGAGASASTPNGTTESRTRRRFTHFHFRKRTHLENRSVSGPALAVVDAEPAHAADGDASGNSKKGEKEVEVEGVRVTIRLAALDEQGAELASPNEQVTYLHVVRFGNKAPKAAAVAEGGEDGKDAEEGEDEDTRPWVVKVVKREATIGPHTFHLHEIYGLSSSSSATHAPTAPLPDSHTYPPASPTSPNLNQITDDDDGTSSECLLCLSAAREVVLLPCRHLVACKDCALNMVEFGAGGTITQAEEPVTATPGADGEDAANEAPSVAAVTPVTPALPAAPRRKRKAKGWFCPVCRQPYTSLLRITTTPPPPVDPSKANAKETEVDITDAAGPSAEDAPRGLLGGFSRPAFLRGFSSRIGDVESQTPVRA